MKTLRTRRFRCEEVETSELVDMEDEALLESWSCIAANQTQFLGDQKFSKKTFELTPSTFPGFLQPF